MTPPGGPEVMFLTHDWSRSALFLRTRAALPVGTSVQLSTVVPGQRHPVTFSGTVRRIVDQHEADGDRPPGMAVSFGRLPIPLAAHLSALAAKQRLLTPQPERVVEAPALLLLGGPGLERLKYATFLEANGFDVTNADTLEQALGALAAGLKPRIVVAVGDPAAALELERRILLGGYEAPELSVILGTMPGYAGGIEHAVMALPRATTPEGLAAHLRGELAVPHDHTVPTPPTE